MSRVLSRIIASGLALVATYAWAQAPNDAATQYERQDLGVAATKQLHAGAMHGPTPASIPGGQVVTTKGLVALAQQQPPVPFIVFDALGQGEILPNAVPAAWLAQPGTFDDAVQEQATQAFARITQGRKDVVLVFYCLSRECWMSYNAALRAIAAGYRNVLWYRGGLEAWKAAGMPTGSSQGAAQPSNAAYRGAAPPGFVRIDPAAPRASSAPPPSELQIQQTRFFSFALPQGWRVGEDGQYALTLLSPDGQALTVMVGNAGFPIGLAPAAFAQQKLSAMQPQNLQIGNGRAARPAAGFPQAIEFDVSYVARGVAYQGVAKVSMAPAYDTKTMVMTAALSSADRWASYASWLPQVADQVSATNGAAFGARGVMAQNLQNSTAFAQAARDYRDWSQKNWQGVVDQRNASQDRRNFAVRENLGGVQTFANPYGNQQPVELPMTSKYYWTDRQGAVVGTDDPRADPNAGSTGEWRRMERVTR